MEALLGLQESAEPPEPPAPSVAPVAPVEPRSLRRRTAGQKLPPARFRQRMEQHERAAEAADAMPPRAGDQGDCDKGARKAIDETKAVHAQYWRCLRDAATPPCDDAARPPAGPAAAIATVTDENVDPGTDAAVLASRLAKMDLRTS